MFQEGVKHKDACVLPLSKQGPPKLVARSVNMTGCQYGNEHHIYFFTNGLKYN